MVFQQDEKRDDVYPWVLISIYWGRVDGYYFQIIIIIY